MNAAERLYWAAGVRSAATGLTGVILGLALAERGFGAGTLGLVVGAGLAGGAAGTALVAWYGDGAGRRALLLAATALTALGYGAVALAPSAALLVLTAFLGLLNGFGRDRGPAQTLDLGMLAGVAADADRTRLFSRYTFIQDVAGAVGALGARVNLSAVRAGVLRRAAQLNGSSVPLTTPAGVFPSQATPT